MRKMLLILPVLLLMCGMLSGQIQNYYTFVASTATYTAITGTDVPSAIGDDVISTPIDIGFTFVYGVTPFTQVKIASNGYVAMGATIGSTLTNSLASTTYCPVVAPLWDDTDTAGGSVQYLLSGTAPNRIFTIQYTGLQWNYSSTTSFNYQVKLYETGKVEFNYDTTASTPTSASASIGINMQPGGANNYYSITPGTPATSSTTTENTAVAAWPGANALYQFNPPVATPNDLAALSITGNATPSVGTASNYTITIRNFGTSPQNVYSVKLMSGTTELGSVAGTQIEPSTNLNVTIPWTPTATGPMALYGKVVLTGDANVVNDQSTPMNVTVMPEGTTVVSIGAGDQTTYLMPMDMYYKNSLFETIYQSAEITTGGILTAVSFYNNFVTDLPNMPTNIWMGLTTQTDLSAGWIPSTQLTQVFNGTVNYPIGSNLITITLTTPFPYTGGNLVMMVQRPMDTLSYPIGNVFRVQTVGTNRSRRLQSSTVTYDPAAPTPAGTLTGQFPKTLLHFTAAGDEPEFAMAPESYNYGQLLMNQSRSQQFSVMNIGGAPLTITNVTIAGSPYFTLQNLPTLPLVLTSGQSSLFQGIYAPTAAGAHTATITVTDNLARVEHTVPLTGTCLDPTIYTSPYAQAFDGVTVPNLPIDWAKLFTQAGNVTTVTTTPHSAPNCVYLYNSLDTAGPYLISPPVAETLPINTMRIKFWAKGSNTYSVNVGIMNNSADAATFTAVQTVTLTNAWAEYTVGFQTYTGTGHYIAIKHGNVGTYQSIYIDDVMIEVIPSNDLAALSIAGNTTPTAGNPTSYTVNVFNWGTVAQTNYQVKLFTTGDVELASTAGTAVDPGMAANTTLSWTPSTAGAMIIYGKVLLTGDQNALNDQTPIMNLTVQPTGTTVVTIGAGDQTARMPLDMFYKNSLFETIYQATEIATGGMITGVSFYSNFLTNLPNMPTKIWLGMTALNDLSGGWVPSTQLTQVFDGTVNYPSGQNTITIQFPIPFAYGGTNLIMMVKRPMDTVYYSASDLFYGQTVGTNRTLNVFNDVTDYDPAAPPAGTTPTGQFPKTSLYFTAGGVDPTFGIAPAEKNYGTVLMNSNNTQNFTFFNMGGGSLTVNSVTLSGSPMYALTNLPTLPITLASGQTASFTAVYHPTAAGTHTATITVTDNLTRTRTAHPVQLTGTCVDPTIYTSPYVQAFDAVTAPNLPIDWQKLVQATVTAANATTSTTAPHSTPNCASLANSSDAAATVLLIAPPLTNTLNLTAMRIKFWAKAGNGEPVVVGVMTNPTDAATFTTVSTVTLTNVWTEYVVGFQTYAGTGRHIAFKHGLGGTYRINYIDDVTIENTPQNDISALSVSGNTTPSVGITTDYTVSVFNYGINPQSAYQVKLFTQDNSEVGSVAGPLLNPGLQANVTVPWQPTVAGPNAIYGKVVLTGDQNATNDQTANYSVSVQAAGTMVVTVGDGSQPARMPVDMYYRNSMFESLYFTTELNFVGMITGISFYNNFTTNLPAMPTKVWLGTTTQTDLSAGWIASTSMTQVFDGNVDYPSGQNTITITFPTPFLYLENNLVMLVNRPMDTQYYSTSDNFYCQTVGNNRARNVFSDGTTYDPAVPPTTGTATGQFPKTSFYVIPGGVGHLTGHVYGAGNLPLANTTIQILNGVSTTTDAEGYYMIHNLIDGPYTVTASRYGYFEQTVNVTIPEDETVTQNFTLTQMPTVTVTGTIVGSDAPTVGLPGATISLTGYEDYSVTANAQGVFTIPGVYVTQTYEYTAEANGYTTTDGEVVVGTVNLNMGNVILNEIAYSPRNVQANEAANHSEVTLNWLVPDPNAVDVTQSFEADLFPPANWTRVITDNGPPNTSGVYPTWCRFGNVTVSGEEAVPTEGVWQAGFWWSYSHQDEWLITPQFNCPQGAMLTFDSFVFLGSVNGDHYYVKATTDNGNTWTVLWDASALTGGWNYYDTQVSINLEQFTGQQIKLAWHADDPASTSDGMWYVWFIDNVVIGNNTMSIVFPTDQLVSTSTVLTRSTTKNPAPLSFSRKPADQIHQIRRQNLSLSGNHQTRHTDRSLVGYKVYRLVQGQEQNETTWSLLTANTITENSYTDPGWLTLAEGTYKWAVKAVYTNDVLSLAIFSNALAKGPVELGTLAGNVRNHLNQPIMGAIVTVGTLTTTTSANGGYSLQVPVGTHSVGCSATGYTSAQQDNMVVTAGQTTVCHFNLTPVDVDDNVIIAATALKGNYPNPFNPRTTISFDLKDHSPVRIDIYNAKGQLIKTLVDEVKASGHYTVDWNGTDSHGKPVASGVYSYRMRSGKYTSTQRMMLMK